MVSIYLSINLSLYLYLYHYYHSIMFCWQHKSIILDYRPVITAIWKLVCMFLFWFHRPFQKLLDVFDETSVFCGQFISGSGNSYDDWGFYDNTKLWACRQKSCFNGQGIAFIWLHLYFPNAIIPNALIPTRSLSRLWLSRMDDVTIPCSLRVYPRARAKGTWYYPFGIVEFGKSMYRDSCSSGLYYSG